MGNLKNFEVFLELVPTSSYLTHGPICRRVRVHAHACTYVCTHALGPRLKILGAIRISAQEQNSGSNAISHLQFDNAVLRCNFTLAIH